MTNYLELAKRLFDWNKINLTNQANLQKVELGNYFAPNFIVKANGREYNGNYDNYYDFLNQFRLTIETISYSIGEEIIQNRRIALPLKVQIKRTSGKQESFDAILILQFDESDKICLWHEVYITINFSN